MGNLGILREKQGNLGEKWGKMKNGKIEKWEKIGENGGKE